MKTKIIAAIAASLAWAGAAHADEMVPYVGGGFSIQRLEGKAGGFNTLGAFSNDSKSLQTVFAARITLGASNLVSLSDTISLRGEIEGFLPQKSSYHTFSLAPYYDTNDHFYGGFANLWLDMKLPAPLDGTTAFVGGGVGAFHHELTANDSVVYGQESSNKFAYNLGGGIKHNLFGAYDLVVGLRYVDYGRIETPLNGGTNGNYTLKQSGVEANIGISVPLAQLF